MADPNSKPASYDELVAVLKNLPLLVRETRRRRGMSLRATAEAVGCSFSTVTRVEAGEDLVLSNAVDIIEWIGLRDDLAGGDSNGG